MEQILKADLVKPKYDKVKEVWAKLLAEYYHSDGNLKSEYVMEVPCPFCKSKKTHSPFAINGFQHVTCSECDVVYVTPRLKDECLEKLYSDKYYSEVYAESMIPVFEIRKKLIGERKCKQTLGFTKNPTAPLRVLDIGCGVGEVIDVFKDLGHDCTAIEVNPIAVSWLQEKKIKVFADSFDLFPEEEKFDVIMAWGVVEHVVNPHDFVKKALRQLKPGGIFVSEVPSGQCLTVDYTRNTNRDPVRIIMGEQHIILYSLGAYESLHVQAGFEKVHVQTNGLDVETILKMNKQDVSDSVIAEMQKCVDFYGKGDLIRGFWRKQT